MSSTAATSVTPDLSLHISPPSSPAAGGEMPEPGTLRLGLDTAAKTAYAAQRSHLVQQRLHQPTQTAHGFNKSSGAGGKRRSRAPRMRWTTALHAHFVHAVELLGGHESMFDSSECNNQHCPCMFYICVKTFCRSCSTCCQFSWSP
jgi:hypothetical protein